LPSQKKPWEAKRYGKERIMADLQTGLYPDRSAAGLADLNWAVLGTGHIANTFAAAMEEAGAAKAAVCATSLVKAEAFAAQYGFARCYDHFGAMLEEAKPDVLYVAAPNLFHDKYVTAALERGVHVLCEKPMADNVPQLEKMISLAKKQGLFLMEGMWTRCFPAVAKVREWLEAGSIGAVKAVRADFGLKAVEGWQGWKASASHGGGALRDVGIYALAWAFLAYAGESPEKVDSVYRLKDGADFHSELLLRYSGNRTAFLTVSFDMVTGHEAVIYGDRGVITAGPRFWCPREAKLYRYHLSEEFVREEAETFTDDYTLSGMQYEIAHVAECIRSGRTESPLFALEESLAIARLIDSLRKTWGVRYVTDSW
jgi:predicted dehydrogenase